MKLNILGSSSTGNCYILQSDTEALIIEAGVRIDKIKQGINYDLNKVAGCIVSHLHGDHAKSVSELLSAGVDVYAHKTVFDTKGIDHHHRAKVIEAGKGYLIGNFKVFSFAVSHDVPCLGFLITHEETGSILFLTDTFTCDYKFDNLSHILIEANYADDVLNKNIESGRVPSVMRRRLLFSHMEIETTKTILLAHDLTGVNTITLIHLSSDNSSEKRFVDEIQAATGKCVRAAYKGLEFSLTKEPY